MPKFRFIPEIAVADSAFEAFGKELNELFENCALATFTEMVDLKTVSPKEKKVIQLSSEKLESLLYDFLSEILFIKDHESIVFSKVKCEINEAGVCLPTGECKEKFVLEAEILGEKIDQKKHKLGNDVKAITMHMFQVAKDKKGWKARVVLDI